MMYLSPKQEYYRLLKNHVERLLYVFFTNAFRNSDLRLFLMYLLFNLYTALPRSVRGGEQHIKTILKPLKLIVIRF